MLIKIFFALLFVFQVSAGVTCAIAREDLITLHESKQKCLTVKGGVKYIGVGFNLARKTAQEDLNSVGANYNMIISNQSCLDDNQIAQLLAKDIQRTLQLTKGPVNFFDNLQVCAQNVLLDLGFSDAANNGKTIFADQEWKNILTLLRNGDYKGASSAVKGLKRCGTDWKLKCTDDVALLASITKPARLWVSTEK